MKELDELGINLCKGQGNLFVESLDRYTGSSSIFIKRFMNCKECFRIDKYYEFDSAGIFEEMENRYDLQRGKEKFDPEAMYWVGYLYRYWAYVYEKSSSQIYKIISGKELSMLYGPYHTLDPKAAIDRICEAKGVDQQISQLQILKRIYLM